MKQRAMALMIVAGLALVGCGNGATKPHAASATEKSQALQEKPDDSMATKAGKAGLRAREKAEELQKQENERVKEINAAEEAQ
ncbi:MAG: hypothetical protein WBX15_13840 [Thermoanaerobaculia bacterium]